MDITPDTAHHLQRLGWLSPDEAWRLKQNLAAMVDAHDEIRAETLQEAINELNNAGHQAAALMVRNLLNVLPGV